MLALLRNWALGNSQLLAVGALLLGLAYAGGRWQGYGSGYDQAKAQGDADLANLKAAHADAVAKAEVEARQRLLLAQHDATRLGDALSEARAELQATQTQLKRRIAHVTTSYRPAPGAAAQALPQPVFTWGFVRLWNDAIGAGGPRLPEAGTACGADPKAGAAQGADAGLCRDELTPSGLTAADVLAHVTDYGARCLGLEQQLKAWIEFSHHL